MQLWGMQRRQWPLISFTFWVDTQQTGIPILPFHMFGDETTPPPLLCLPEPMPFHVSIQPLLSSSSEPLVPFLTQPLPTHTAHQHQHTAHTSLHPGINVGDALAGLHREGVRGSSGKVGHLGVHRAVAALEGRRELEPSGQRKHHGVRPGQHVGEVVEAVGSGGRRGDHLAVAHQLHKHPSDAGLAGVLDAVAVQVVPHSVANGGVW